MMVKTLRSHAFHTGMSIDLKYFRHTLLSMIMFLCIQFVPKSPTELETLITLANGTQEMKCKHLWKWNKGLTSTNYKSWFINWNLKKLERFGVSGERKNMKFLIVNLGADSKFNLCSDTTFQTIIGFNQLFE